MQYTEEHAPLVLIGFSRPDLLDKQLSVVRAHFRGRIFCVVDGPRTGREGEKEKVEQVLYTYFELHPDFHVSINSSKDNRGCCRRIMSGLDWVFDQVDRAIVLEDDCLPHPDFFSFASEMLNRFSGDTRISSVLGTNLYPDLSPKGCRFFYSHYQNCWGWGTWKTRWSTSIREEGAWLKVRGAKEFRRKFPNFRSFLYWRHIFDETYKGNINSWFYRWMLTCWVHDQLAVVPSSNLVLNNGGNQEGTHTMDAVYFNNRLSGLDFSAEEPGSIHINAPYDQRLEDIMYSKSPLNRVRWMMRKVLVRSRKGL